MVTLPVEGILEDCVRALNAYSSCIILAPPGAGKSTRVPIFLQKELGGKWLMLQPRRIAVRALADRMSREQGWQLGQEVGYQIRFEEKSSASTKIKIVTEGILTRMLLGDSALSGWAGIILDEFHERNHHTDLGFAMLRELQESLRPDLKIVVMSATLDPDPISRFLGNVPVIKSEGKMFPVEVKYFSELYPQIRGNLEQKILQSLQFVLGEPGTENILVFLPGAPEIERAYELCCNVVESFGRKLIRLHGSVSWEDQRSAVQEEKQKKVILATNIAETSLTIPGVNVVIDSGLVKILRCDPALGIDRLELEFVSLASAEQRKGRSGRQGPGLCVRLWTKDEEKRFPLFPIPEIRRIDLSPVLLSVGQWGNIGSFQWFEKPTESSLVQGQKNLESLGALVDGKITEVGRKMGRLPLHPRLAKTVLKADELGAINVGLTLAAIVSETIDRKEVDLFREYRFFVEDPKKGKFRKTFQVYEQLASYLRYKGALPYGHERALLEEVLVDGFRDRLAWMPNVNQGVMVGGRGVRLFHDEVAGESFVILLEPREIRQNGTLWVTSDRIMEISEEVLIKIGIVKTVEEARACTERGVVENYRVLRLGDVIVREAKIGESAAGIAQDDLRKKALKSRWNQWLDSNLDFKSWINRISLFWRYTQKEELDFDGIFLKVSDFLPQRIDRIDALEFQKIFEDLLEYKIRKQFDEVLPEQMLVPSGSKIKIIYEHDRAVLAVRLQEVFGWTSSPQLLKGQIPVVLHLLAPNYRPVQITQDLSGFWKTSYFEVRKELRSRYPKHAWPEDPLTAKPEAKGRRRQ